MRRTVATIAVCLASVAALLSLLFAGPQPGLAATDTPSEHVVLVLAPYLSWDDITPTSTPTIWRIAENGAVGDLNARSRTRVIVDEPSPNEGALTISAGSWATNDPEAPAPYQVSERYETGSAAEAYRRTTGGNVGDNAIVYLGLPTAQRMNEELSFDVVLGTLGQSIVDADGLTAAIGNSDVGYVTGEQRRVRPAALAAMDESGLVPLGDVSQRLLHADPNAPFGLSTDQEVFAETWSAVADELYAAAGPTLVVLDAGDLHRAARFARFVTPEIAHEQHLRALGTLDETVRLALERMPEGGTLIISSQTLSENSQPSRPEGLGPVVVSGPGWSGYLTSSSTQREGLVTNLDVTATILDTLGLKQPLQVIGNPMADVPDGTLASRIERLDALNETAVAVDGVKADVINTYVACLIILFALSTFVLLRWRHWRPELVSRWVHTLHAILLLALCAPPASWLMFVVDRYPSTEAAVIAAFLGVMLLLWAVLLVVRRVAGLRLPVALAALGTVALLLVDQWVGWPLSYVNFWGYSPLLGARFYGMGNEAAALLFGALIVGAALLADQYPTSPRTKFITRWVFPVVALVTVATAAAPALGANVGVAVWGTFGFALAWWLANGHRVTWKLGLVIVALSLTFLGVFAFLDLVGGVSQTHLGRAISSAEQGGLTELWKIVARKAETNIRVLTHTVWAYVLLVVLAFLAFMRFRPQGDFAETLAENPRFGDAITVALLTGLVAYFTEDSGIVIPAMISLYLGTGILYLMLARLMRGSVDADVAE